MQVSYKMSLVALVGAVAALAAASGAGCGGDSGTAAGSGDEGGGGSKGTGGHMGHGGHMMATSSTGSSSGGAEPTGPIKKATDVAAGLAFDATLSNDGTIAYFTGTTPKGGAVFSAPSSGGSQPHILAQSAACVAPFGIALSVDGKTLYVADPGAGFSSTTPPTDGGAIWTVSSEGGNFTQVMGGTDLVARSLDVVSESGKDAVWFTGAKAGKPGVFKLVGSTVTTVAQTSDFHDPGGIAVAKNGKAYVVDTIAGSYRDASILQISGSTVSVMLQHLWVGYPAGVALSHDEKTLVVSGLRDQHGHAAVLQIDMASFEIKYFPDDAASTSPFMKLLEPGGLHRARDVESFAWVNGDTGPATGGVSLLE